MRVCLDVTSTAGVRAGISNYAAALAERLPSAMPADELVLFSSFRPGPGRAPVRSAAPNARESTWRIPMRLLEASWRLFGAPSFERLAGPCDIVHVPHPRFPPRRRARLAVTVMDLSAYRNAAWGGPSPSMDALQRGLDAADAVIVPSEATARAIRESSLCKSSKIHVTLLGVDADRFAAPPPETVRARLAPFGLEPDTYALFVGAIQPRKNLVRLIHAFGRVRVRLPSDARLVLAGPAGWENEDVGRAAAAPGLDGSVRRLAYVPDTDLPALYAGARLLALPSLDEGFGFPVLEAMAAGTPVACSNAGSLPEIAGDAARIFDPLDPAAIASALESCWLDEALRARLRVDGLARARSFTWEATARQTLEVYRKVTA